MKTIKQLSTELGISKEAIYKKLKFQLKEQLKGHAVKVDNVTRVDEEGELIIRQSLQKERREAIETVMDAVVEDGSLFEPTGGQAHLTEYVNLLREQIRTKDVQIENQSGHIGQLIRQLGLVQLLPQVKEFGARNFEENYEDKQPLSVKRKKGAAKLVKDSNRRRVWKNIFGRREVMR